MIKIQGKYDGLPRYYAVRAQRAALRGMIRPMVRWQRMKSPRDGYSIVLGCTHRLHGMLSTNLLMLTRQDLTHLHEVIVVVDEVKENMPAAFERELVQRYPQLPLRFLYYTPAQSKVAGLVGWAWVYAWLSWCIGISAVETRYALLHDFDAMLVRPNVLRERYELLQQEAIDYLGVRYYVGNGVAEDDRLVTTFEMMFDCAFVRYHFKPLDLFNHVCWWRGKTVDFDTFLYPQSRLGRTGLLELEPKDMVHPSQMVCQFTELMNGRELNPSRSSLLMIPYFFSVADQSDPIMQHIRRQLDHNVHRGVEFFGKHIQLDRLQSEHVQWLASQAERLDTAVFGSMRDDVRAYFDEIGERAGGATEIAAHAR